MKQCLHLLRLSLPSQSVYFMKSTWHQKINQQSETKIVWILFTLCNHTLLPWTAPYLHEKNFSLRQHCLLFAASPTWDPASDCLCFVWWNQPASWSGSRVQRWHVTVLGTELWFRSISLGPCSRASETCVLFAAPHTWQHIQQVLIPRRGVHFGQLIVLEGWCWDYS